MKRTPKTTAFGLTALIILMHILLYINTIGRFTPGDYSALDILLTFTSIICIVAVAWYISVLLPKNTDNAEETPVSAPRTLEDSCGVSSTTWVDEETYTFSRPLKQEEHIGWMSRLPEGRQRINSVRDAFNLSK